MSTGIGKTERSDLNKQSISHNLTDQRIADLDVRIGQLEQRTSKVRVFGIEDVLANRINNIGKFSAIGVGSWVLCCLWQRAFFPPRFPF